MQSTGGQFTLLSLSSTVCGNTIQALHLMRPTENLSKLVYNSSAGQRQAIHEFQKSLSYMTRSEDRTRTGSETSILKSVSDVVGGLVVVSMGLAVLNSGIDMHHRRRTARWEREINTINGMAL